MSRSRPAVRRRRIGTGVTVLVVIAGVAALVAFGVNEAERHLGLPLNHATIIREQAAAKHLDPALIADAEKAQAVAQVIARRLGIDPLIVRVGFIATTAAGGIGLALYLLAWALMPGEQSERAPIERIAGDQASVQMLDAVARFGLDTSVQQTAFLVGTVSDAVGTFNYTVLGGGRIAPDPAWVSEHIATGTVPIIGSVTCNRLIFPQLEAALREIEARGLADEIHADEYAGCYYPRFIAGTTSLSNHSFGLALDFNVSGNQRGTVGEMDRTVVAIFKKWGFAWGGDWRYTDPMHFEMNAVVDPR